MNRVLFGAALLFASLIAAGEALADLRVDPKERPPVVAPAEVSAPLEIKTDPKVETARVVIPRKFLVVDAAPGKKKTGSWELKLPTMIAGMSLALAMASIPFFTRWGRSNRLAAAALLGILVAGTAVSFAFADLGPGPRPRPPKSTPAPVVATKADRVTIVLTDEGDKVTMIFPAPAAAKTAEPPGR